MIESRTHRDHRTDVARRSCLAQMIISPASQGSIGSDDTGMTISGADLLDFVNVIRHFTLENRIGPPARKRAIILQGADVKSAGADLRNSAHPCGDCRPARIVTPAPQYPVGPYRARPASSGIHTRDSAQVARRLGLATPCIAPAQERVVALHSACVVQPCAYLQNGRGFLRNSCRCARSARVLTCRKQNDQNQSCRDVRHRGAKNLDANKSTIARGTSLPSRSLAKNITPSISYRRSTATCSSFSEHTR